MHNDFKKILGQFEAHYGKEEGTRQFNKWVEKRKLDTSLPYSELQLKKKCKAGAKCEKKCGACFKESFQWAKPLIKLLKKDNEAKYYQVEAHFVITSMNGNIYTLEELWRAIHTLPGQHVDLDHNLEWIIKPIDITAAMVEDGCSECIVRVPNGTKDAKGRDCQECFEDGTYDCVSVEVDALAVNNDPAKESGPGNELLGMSYTGLALLDQDSLPGIPLTRIIPVEKLVESIFGTAESLETNVIEVNEKMNETQTEESFGDTSFPDSSFAYVPDSAKGADGKKSDRKLPYKDASGKVDLPHVRNALARLDQTDGPSQSQKDSIRSMLQGILKKESGSEAATSQPTSGMTAKYCPLCGSELKGDTCVNSKCPANGSKISVNGESITIVSEQASLNQKIADLTEEVSKLTKKHTAVEMDLKERDGKVTDLSEKLAKATRENVKIPLLEEELRNQRTKTSEAITDGNEQRGKSAGYAETVAKVEKERNDERALRLKAEEKNGELKVALEASQRELNEESTKRAAAEQKALNETKEYSRIKLENAEVLEEKSKDTRKISDLSGQVSEMAKAKLTLEKENASLKEEVKKRDGIIIEEQKLKEKALHKQTEAYKIMKQNGIYQVDDKGNLIL